MAGQPGVKGHEGKVLEGFTHEFEGVNGVRFQLRGGWASRRADAGDGDAPGRRPAGAPSGGARHPEPAPARWLHDVPSRARRRDAIDLELDPLLTGKACWQEAFE